MIFFSLYRNITKKISLVIRPAGIVLMMVLSFLPSGVLSQTREELEEEFKKIQEEIAAYEKELAQTKTEKQTLTNKINKLKKEQDKVVLQIKATNIQINELGKELGATEASIQTTRGKLDILRSQTTMILRAIYEQDKTPLFAALAGSDGLAAFFDELETLEKLSEGLSVIVGEVKTAKAELETHHGNLEVKQGEKKNLLAIQTLQRNEVQAKSREQNKILKVTQGKEAQYQKMLTDSKKRAEEIRSRIYELLGVSSQITFGEAVGIAQWVSGQTGVRPALVLAVLTQESNLGSNVGTCNRPGDPPSKGWRAVMKPARDQEPFLAITGELNMNPDITPVSCPMRDAAGNQVGWGGAMGPAQFIPSTWMLYKDKVAAVTGKRPANPWDIRDAFVASALLLKDNGAEAGNEDAEWAAVMKYFSGSTNPRFRFYGDSVMALAWRYEEDIKALQ